jgi:predicted  nucleic acid-binding Zn-ribbon protein
MATNVTIVEGGIDFDRFDPTETVDTETGALRIEKRIAATDTGRVIVDLRAEPVGEEVVGAWIVERLPPDVDPETVDAHRDVDPDRWSITGASNLRFEIVVDPDETAGVGFVATEVDDPEAFFDPPKVVETETMGPSDSGTVEATASDVFERRTKDGDSGSERTDSIASKVREALSVPSETGTGRRRSVDRKKSERDDLEFEFRTGNDAGADPEGSDEGVRPSTDGTAENASTAETDGGDGSDGETLVRGSSTSSAEGTKSSVRAVTPEEVPTVFVNQLESGALSDEDVEALREALGVETPRSTATRIEHVESRLTEFEAYIEALEAFIDDNGTADEIIADLEATIDDLSETVASVEDELEGIREQQADLREAVDGHDEALSTVEKRLDGLAGKIDALERTTADQGSRIEDLEAGQADLRSDMVQGRRELRSDLEDGRAELRSDLDERRQELRSDLADDREALTSDLEASIDEVESDVEELSNRFDSIESSWRKVKDAFGGD